MCISISLCLSSNIFFYHFFHCTIPLQPHVIWFGQKKQFKSVHFLIVIEWWVDDTFLSTFSSVKSFLLNIDCIEWIEFCSTELHTIHFCAHTMHNIIILRFGTFQMGYNKNKSDEHNHISNWFWSFWSGGRQTG